MSIKSKIVDLDYYGRGISKDKSKIFFVSNALPEEEVEIEIIKEEKKYSEAIVTNYLLTSNKRVKVNCPYYDKCGGCNISHMSYEDQLDFKKIKIKEILKRKANIETNLNIINAGDAFNYRNKATLKINNYKWGYYQSKSHNFIEIDYCYIVKKSINNIITYKDCFKIKDGEITIRTNHEDEMLISITTDEKEHINLEKLSKNNKIVGIIINDKIIFGKDYFIEKVGNYYFKVSYKSFFQVNLKILEEIFNPLSKKKYSKVIDLYCGVGTLGIPLNKEKLYGIEINKTAISDAKYNSVLNKQKDNDYYASSSSFINTISDDVDLIIIDPPRSGIDFKTMKDIMEKQAQEIIYMSCNPETFARDLNILKESYNIKEFYLYDMFPQTHHVETVVLMSRVKD